MPRPLVIAHRGDSSRALENSLEAIRLALSIPVDMIEFDVRKSRDNALYIMHDQHTGRTANSNINIEKALSGKISRLRLKNGEPIPTLNDVLALVNGMVGVNIEIKSEGAGALTAECLARSGYQGRVLISSFREAEVVGARQAMPSVLVAGIFDTFMPGEINAYHTNGYRFISLNYNTVTEQLISLCHQIGIVVYVWTVDDEKDMRRLIAWNVDGIYSNRPDVLRRIVGEADQKCDVF